MSISDKNGKTIGGHLCNNNKVYTTVEVIILEISNLFFDRDDDSQTKYKELKIYKEV
jgi:predicted DNA-binding protein with PD1-like motif